jgi:hypothetical protein
MSIEQKIAELLAESNATQFDEEVEEVVEEVVEETTDELEEATDINDPCDSDEENADNKKNNVDKQKLEKKSMKEESTLDISEDVAALTNGEDLSEEFKAKAATIFEAAVVNRVKQEVAALEEEFDAKLEEAVAQTQEALVEKVDGYLNYVVETWMVDNELALERGMKSEIFESFVSGMKGLFEEHYIDVPEEKFDLIGEMEETIESLNGKLDEQLAVNVEMKKLLDEAARVEIVTESCEGLTDTEKEKFVSLVEELSYENSETFEKKVQTIRENYFTNKATTKSNISSVVTDEPVSLTEEKVIPADMKRYVQALNNLK